jgi:hypothetical protein
LVRDFAAAAQHDERLPAREVGCRRKSGRFMQLRSKLPRLQNRAGFPGTGRKLNCCVELLPYAGIVPRRGVIHWQR